jgi:hypothetical protein
VSLLLERIKGRTDARHLTTAPTLKVRRSTAPRRGPELRLNGSPAICLDAPARSPTATTAESS